MRRKINISSALFDVRPVTERGNLDVERIKQVKGLVDLREAETEGETERKEKAIKIKPAREIIEERIVFEEEMTREKAIAELASEMEVLDSLPEIKPVEIVKEKEEKPEEIHPEASDFYFPEVASQEYPQPVVESKEPVIDKISSWSIPRFLITGFLIALLIPIFTWLSQGLEIKDEVLGSGSSAYQNLLMAKESLEKADFETAEKNFNLAHADFLETQNEINKLGRLTVGILGKLPGGSLVSSGSHLVKVGENLADAGQTLSSAIQLFSFGNLFELIETPSSDNVLASKEEGQEYLTEKIALSQSNLETALKDIEVAIEELRQVKIDALPDEIQPEVVSLGEKLPLVEEMLEGALDYSAAFLKILGHNNPRQYLLIFQNNSEIRATGGFIGTYGLLELDRGEMTNLFVDGVYNADGQLHEKIIPPRPIQKVSTAWSMHDANWFPDFPTSAEKISWFYEKTGGPTVDGVISLTPTVIERLLELTGPISMPEYEVVLDSNNFVELIQYKVEIDYDKELNQPKKILADFAPLFIKKLEEFDSEKKKKAVEIFLDAFEEKHILAYFKDSSLQQLAIEEGWAGELKETSKDFLSIVSSNINGFKTDRVVDESINLLSEIGEDGSIINTLTVTRIHQGGQTNYDWWNRVNANFLRVYLPLGSELISASGQTRENYHPPIDYEKQGFKKDPLVNEIESKMIVDLKTNTRIFEENKKTVFGNWVYVSPGETVTLTYQYRLPFEINLTKMTDSYSLLIQKQLGSLGSNFSHQLKFPENWDVSWQYPENMNQESGIRNYDTDLKTDKFLGLTFEF